MSPRLYFLAAIVSIFLAVPVSAQYSDWKHSGSIYILTTPEGADLPASAVERDFPLLVRLDKDAFPFNEAQANGADLRFSLDGSPLAYQIESWNAKDGVASVWVRIPIIRGDARQKITLHWGRADAASESNGAAVFGKSNGYLSVLHLSDPNQPVKDDAGTLTPTNVGTQPSAGIIGGGRRFAKTQGIKGGDDIKNYPATEGAHTSQAWIKTDGPQASFLSWGDGKPDIDVALEVQRPSNIRVASYHGGSYIVGSELKYVGEWAQVSFVHDEKGSRVYVNGRLDGTGRVRPKSVGEPKPVKMWIGGWYGKFSFIGEMDEVRISNVARSADWIKLEYENQKHRQTLVGTLVQPGRDFQVSAKAITLGEGKSASLTAKAGGAQKVYWVLKRGATEEVVAADDFTYVYESGRVARETRETLQFKAVYGDEVKTIDVPIVIENSIPEPVFTLKAPTAWNGRDTIEVVPTIANLAAMQASGVGELTRTWTVSGGATIREQSPDRLTLKRSQYTGPITVQLAIGNGGPPSVVSVPIQITEPKSEPWQVRTPEKDEKPEENQFYARDDKNEGTLYYNGTLDEAAEEVFLKLYADDRLIKTENLKPGADKSYAFAVKLKPGLIRYKVEFGVKNGQTETVRHSVDHLVCGDAYLIEGQSNAVAFNYHNQSNREDLTRRANPWIRSFGHTDGAKDVNAGRWGTARVDLVTPDASSHYFIGVWGMAMAQKLVADDKMPICIINGARGGTRVKEHLPNPVDHRSTSDPAHEIYANLLNRVTAAKLTHGIRGVIWHQGEADQPADEATNRFGYETYQRNFIDLAAAWKQDYPNIQHYYVFQVWPNACSQGGNKWSDLLRDVQRRLPSVFSNLSVLPTAGYPSGAACHFKVEDYEQMGLGLVPLIERDSHGKTFDRPITGPDLVKAFYSGDARDEITLEFDQPVEWKDSLVGMFSLDGGVRVASGIAEGNVVRLRLAAPAQATNVTYLTDRNWDGRTFLAGKNGIAALTFCGVEISAPPPGK